jgi:hypothetical protein
VAHLENLPLSMVQPEDGISATVKDPADPFSFFPQNPHSFPVGMVPEERKEYFHCHGDLNKKPAF